MAVQSVERVPSTLQSAAFWEPLGLVHVLHDENGTFLSCRSCSTVSMSMPTTPFSGGAWPVRTVAGVPVHGSYGPLANPNLNHKAQL